MRPPWWAAFPPAEARIGCGTAEHRLHWENGQLITADHADAEGELVLAALGGDQAECMIMAELWGAHHDDLDVLALGPRSATDVLTLTRESLSDLYSRMRRADPAGSAPMVRGPSPRAAARRSASAAIVHQLRQGPGSEESRRAQARRAQQLPVVALGPDFQQRLCATVAAAWSPDGARAPDADSAKPALVAALTGRLAPAVSSWLGIDADQVSASLQEDSGWGAIKLNGTGPDSRLHASLPCSWLARVWAPGLAVLGDYLVVDVLDVTWPKARVLGAARPGAEPTVLSARHDGEHWSVERKEPP
jgi:hypothetical protein